MITGLALLMVMILGATNAEAISRSMRCDGRLVKSGDFQHEVVAKCGNPTHVETLEDLPDEWVLQRYDDEEERFKAPYLLRSPIKREVWTYRRGSNHLPYYLYFYKGRLTRIEVGSQQAGDHGR